jgi:very-short-patch-repair endonuclease
MVEGFEVDALWSDQRVVAELDGYAFHHSRGAFERDRARDASLQLAGYKVVRITWRRMQRDAQASGEMLRRLLA